MHRSLRDCDPLAELVLVEEDTDRLAFLNHHTRELLRRIDCHRALGALWQLPRLPIRRVSAHVLRVRGEVRARETRILRIAIVVNVNHPAGQPLRRAPGVDKVPLVFPADATILAVAKGLKEMTLLVVFLAGEACTGLSRSIPSVAAFSGLETLLQISILRHRQLHEQQN